MRISNKDGLLNRFACGNVKSLSQDGIRENLLKFHKTWYSANIMTVTLSSKMGIEEMEKQAIEKFSPVKNFDVTVPNLGEVKPFGPENLGLMVKYVPVQDRDVLVLYYILPYVEKEYQSAPLNYFSHLYGHEGENSLLSYLISEGLALELSAGGDHELWAISTFRIEIVLTKKGLENYEKVVEACFQYGQKLKEMGPQEYIF